MANTLLILEITRDIHLVFPLMIAVLAAYGTGNLFTKSFFYSTIELKKMPYIPKLMKDKIYNMKAKDVIQKSRIYLHANSSLHNIFDYLTTAENICIADYLPVILDEKDSTLYGVVRTENLIKYFRFELCNAHLNYRRSWVGKLDILLRIYSFLDEEVSILI